MKTVTIEVPLFLTKEYVADAIMRGYSLSGDYSGDHYDIESNHSQAEIDFVVTHFSMPYAYNSSNQIDSEFQNWIDLASEGVTNITLQEHSHGNQMEDA